MVPEQAPAVFPLAVETATDHGQVRVHCLNPLVVVVDDAFDDRIASDLRARLAAPRRATRIHVPRGVDGRGAIRGSTLVALSRAETLHHPVTTLVARLLAIDPGRMEVMRVIHYEEGGHFAPHTDTLPGRLRRGSEGTALRGQRVYSVIGFLNDVPEGGETLFPRLGLAIAPRRGRLLIFADTEAGSRRAHPRSLHAGSPVRQGEKCILQLMIRQYPPSEEALGAAPDGTGLRGVLRRIERRIRHARKRFAGF